MQGVEVVQQGQTMYNLTVAQAHTFFVGQEQWLVHNACPFSLAQLSKAASEADRGGLTKAGRALQKHSNRGGTAFSKPSGTLNPANYNKAGQNYVNEILNHPNTVINGEIHESFGQIYDAWELSATGTRLRGLRYNAKGVLIGFLEP